jgi:hypothetical protein
MGGGPTFQYGDMFQTAWEQTGNLFVVSTNATISKEGKLVMGRGVAEQLKQRVPGIDKVFGEVLRRHHMQLYGLCVLKLDLIKEKLGHWARVFNDVGAFQVKTHFSNRADPIIIRSAADKLREYALLNPKLTIHMNMPGIGYGYLTEGMVMPFLKDLPKNVNIWRFSHQAPPGHNRPDLAVDDDSDQD